MKFHNLIMIDPEWAAFVNSIAGVDSGKRHRFVESQSGYFPSREYFGGLPSSWFRTLAGGILQELINNCGNDKSLVARRAGMSPTNLYAILNGKNDPKLGTLLRLAYSNGFELCFELKKCQNLLEK
jgi:hypothetical protein